MLCPMCGSNLEIENKTAVVRGKNTLELDENLGLIESLHKLEYFLLTGALKRTGNNRLAASRLLGVKYHTMLYYVEKHGLGEKFPVRKKAEK